jgi:hypothetical protein
MPRYLRLTSLIELMAPAGSGGAIAQLVERVLCKHEVVGSIPSGSTNYSDQTWENGIPARHQSGGFDIVNVGSAPDA